MKICLVGIELSLAELWADKTKLIFGFRIIFRTHLQRTYFTKKKVILNFTAICPLADELTVMESGQI
jgi:hypothetical protein